jgi:hypothetical protein
VELAARRVRYLCCLFPSAVTESDRFGFALDTFLGRHQRCF